jgi:hypothetical protein
MTALVVDDATQHGPGFLSMWDESGGTVQWGLPHLLPVWCLPRTPTPLAASSSSWGESSGALRIPPGGSTYVAGCPNDAEAKP